MIEFKMNGPGRILTNEFWIIIMVIYCTSFAWNEVISCMNFIQNIPVRMDIENAVLSDIGMVEFNSKEGYPKTKFFIANSSLGVTAQANYLFNQGDWVINFLSWCSFYKFMISFLNLEFSLHKFCSTFCSIQVCKNLEKRSGTFWVKVCFISQQIDISDL